jgi:FkbM family methyltransferase
LLNCIQTIKNLTTSWISGKDEFSKVMHNIGLRQNLNIFDVGAHKGQTSSYFCKVFPNCFIYAFEPSSVLFKILEQNLKYRNNIECSNFAFGESEKNAYLTHPTSDLCGQVTSIEDLNSSRIKVKRIDKFCLKKDISQIDLLKIDVEGYELSVLEGSRNLMQQNSIKAILLECDFNKEDTQHSYFFDIYEYLVPQNFSFHGLFDVVRYSPKYGIGYCNALFINRSAFN